MGVKDNLGSSADNPRSVHVLSKDHALRDGETYQGWPCKACGWFIAIDQSWPEAVRIPDAAT